MTHEPNPAGALIQEPRQARTGAGEASAIAAVRDDLRALHAVVAEFADVNTRIRTLAFWARDRIVDNIEYEYAGTPCARSCAATSAIIRPG